MKIASRFAAAGLAMCAVMPAAAMVTLDFEGITVPDSNGFKAPASIGDFYSSQGVTFMNALAVTGGLNVLGAATFGATSYSAISADPGGNGNFWVSSGPATVAGGTPNGIASWDFLNDPRVQTSGKVQPQIGQSVMTFGNTTGARVNVEGGFTSGFSFYFSSQSNLNLSVLDGSGTAMLINVTVTEPNEQDPNELVSLSIDGKTAVFDQQYNLGCSTGARSFPYYCNWSKVDVTFAGSAGSILFANSTGGGLEGDAGTAGTGIDLLTLTNYDAPITSQAPEPSTYAMMLLGLLGIGFIARRRVGEAGGAS